MKVIKFIMIIGLFIIFSLLVIGCTEKHIDNQDIQAYALEMTNTDSPEIDWSDLEAEEINVNRLHLFLNNLRNTHNNLQAKRKDVKDLYLTLSSLREDFKATNQTLSESDYDEIIKAVQLIRIKQFMLQQTIGQGYQQLSLVINNHSDFDRETNKAMLTQVYLTFQARIQIYEEIYDSLNSIITILNNYMET